MKYLLTGACGFIGSNIAFSLLKKGHEVLNLDKLTYASNESGFESYSNYRLINIDISRLLDDRKVMKEIIKFQPDYVIHLAAESMVDRSLANNKIFFESNTIGTWNVLEIIKNLDIKKAIFFSTDEVYGSLELSSFIANDVNYGFMPSNTLMPRNPYAGSKAAADQITISYIHSFKLPIIIVRPSNNYGARQADEKLVPVIINSILNGSKIPMYGNGNFYREWLYIEDMITAVQLLLEKGINGEVYNVGSGYRISNLELVNTISMLMDVRAEDFIEYVVDPRGSAHDKAYAVDSSKLRDIGWQSSFSIKQGLINTISYYRSR